MNSQEIKARVKRLPSSLQEDFKERAAMMEYHGEMLCEIAETLAFRLLQAQMRRKSV